MHQALSWLHACKDGTLENCAEWEDNAQLSPGVILGAMQPVRVFFYSGSFWNLDTYAV